MLETTVHNLLALHGESDWYEKYLLMPFKDGTLLEINRKRAPLRVESFTEDMLHETGTRLVITSIERQFYLLFEFKNEEQKEHAKNLALRAGCVIASTG